MNQWIAFYVKYLSEHDPFAMEMHGWQCEAPSADDALIFLETNPAVPYRMFLLEVIPLSQKDTWIAEGNEEAERLGLASPKVVMHQMSL